MKVVNIWLYEFPNGFLWKCNKKKYPTYYYDYDYGNSPPYTEIQNVVHVECVDS